MQLVILSARPAVLAETLVHVRHFMRWIDEVVVVAPQRLLDEMSAIPDVGLLSDEAVSGYPTEALAAMDHASRNTAIRRGLAHQSVIDEQFLMSDDDYRPLKTVEESFFFEGDRHRGFYFYDLDEWPGNSTPFDAGQHHSRELLAYLGVERRSYGAHMPQPIHKAVLSEVWKRVAELTETNLLCEWTIYFNVGRSLRPEMFCEPEPFRTFAWPQYPHEWPWWIRPPEYVFENFYPDLYLPGHLFAGLPTALDADRAERIALEKILRWSDFGQRVARLDFPTDVVNPWTGTSLARRGVFGLLRRVRQVRRYLTLDERSHLAEMSGSLHARGEPRM